VERLVQLVPVPQPQLLELQV
jgi:hypothetical protein